MIDQGNQESTVKSSLADDPEAENEMKRVTQAKRIS